MYMEVEFTFMALLFGIDALLHECFFLKKDAWLMCLVSLYEAHLCKVYNMHHASLSNYLLKLEHQILESKNASQAKFFQHQI